MKKATFTQLTVELPEADEELAQLLLHEGGATAVEVRDGESPPLPGVTAPRAGEALLVAAFESDKAARAIHRRLTAAFPSCRAAVEALPDQDWSTQWRARVRAVEVSRLWVGPPWMADSAPAGKARVLIEPKMAFGTGDHPTTLLCLHALDDDLARHPGASVLDVGTGTGVLAIAARKLGAGRVVGVDNDAVSVEIAQETAAANGEPDLVLSGASLKRIRGRFDVVVANILANTLIELAPLIARKAKRRVTLAGVLVPQRDEVTRAFEAEGCRLTGTAIQGEWIRLDFDAP